MSYWYLLTSSYKSKISNYVEQHSIQDTRVIIAHNTEWLISINRSLCRHTPENSNLASKFGKNGPKWDKTGIFKLSFSIFWLIRLSYLVDKWLITSIPYVKIVLPYFLDNCLLSVRAHILKSNVHLLCYKYLSHQNNGNLDHTYVQTCHLYKLFN